MGAAGDAAGMLAAGGPILVVLLVLSVVSLALIGAKALQLRGAIGDRTVRSAAVTSYLGGNRAAATAALAGRGAPADRLLLAAMEGLAAGRPRAALQAELEWRGNEEMGALQRHLRLLDLIAMVSPLLGLLGTVTGMIQAFQDLAAAEGAANAALLAGGIWQALLTTAAGLIVAIPAAVAASLLAERTERAAQAAEAAVGQLFAGTDGGHG